MQRAVQAARWVRVVAADRLQEGEPLPCVVEGRELALYRVAGAVFATDNLCTHGRARLSDGYLEGHTIECPLHQGSFDVRSGACVSPPVTEPLCTHGARVADGFVEIEITEP